MLAHTLKTAVRVLLRRKFFTAVSLFGVALTLVVIVVVAALLDHTIGAYPPETRWPRSLGVFRVSLKGEGWTRSAGAGGRFLDACVKDLPGAEVATFYSQGDREVTYRDGERLPLWVKRTDGAFWRALDFRFLEGGPYTEADDDAANAVAVVNDATRRRLFGNGPAVGRTLVLDGRTFTVVGVVEDVGAQVRTVKPGDFVVGSFWNPWCSARVASFMSVRPCHNETEIMTLNLTAVI